ncbi:hypothetical protein ASG43_21265 [Aureimonas sp. Leaf454]|nr:hypothetical protein ASG43_21265 [Aureimonas sp. Leaf454]
MDGTPQIVYGNCMLDRLNMTATTRRLLSAALLCLSVILSQMAHASVPSIPMHDAQAQSMVVDVDAAPAHEHQASGHAHGDRDDGSSKAGDHTGPSDTKCASHCPSVFVPIETDADHRDLTRQDAVQPAHASLSGLPGTTADRPPRT